VSRSTHRIRSTLAACFGATLIGLFCAAGCGAGGDASRAAAPRARPSVPAPSPAEVAEARELAQAQLAWCAYLQELYVRAQEGATKWPNFEECAKVRTTASPRMLKQTADCSLRALKQFEGDPFTAEYAAEVSRCGSEALDSMRVSPAELAPIVATVCGRAASCGQIGYAECRQGLEEGLGPRLERALGALNTRARTEVRTCLRSATCADVGAQIASCLEPVLERILWLPG
jgi:hypothetical protein